MTQVSKLLLSRRIYLVLFAAFFALAIAAASLKPSFNFAVSDGFFYYAYLPSLVIDGDLDFGNEIREHGDPGLDPSWKETTSRGYVHNKYTVGFALTLAPTFLAAHALSTGLHALFGSDLFLPDGYTVVYQLFGLATVLLLGAASFVLMEKLLTREFEVEPLSARLAVLLYWTGSHYAYYYFREPFMVHVVSTFWVTNAIYISRAIRFDDSQHRLRALLLGICAAMALVSRPTNAVVLAPFLAPLALRPGFVRTLPVLALAVLPLLPQFAVWKIMHGSFLHYTYHSEGFRWLTPSLGPTLLSSKHGLFFWSPMLLFSVAGLLLGMRFTHAASARRGAVQMLVAFALLWYVNSAWHNWWFGDAFGARAFLEISLLFVLGLAWFLQSSRRFVPGVRRLSYALLAACWVFNYALMGLYVARQIPRADYLF